MCSKKKKINNFGKQIKCPQDKSYLFNNFDPENSLLNEISRPDMRIFQNSRIYVDVHGKQLHDEIIYNDILTFSKLIPNHQFGGRTLIPFDLYL